MAQPSFEPHDNFEEKSLLLDLPAELRNEIYRYVAVSTTKIVIHKGILVPHALARVNRQTRQECWPILVSHSIQQTVPIEAHVLNSDFRSLVTVLNKYIIGKRTNKGDDLQNLDIIITVATLCEHHGDYVRRWLKRCNTNLDMKAFTRTYSVQLDGHDSSVGMLWTNVLGRPTHTPNTARNDGVALHDVAIRAYREAANRDREKSLELTK